ncbi:MAG: GTPase HflX [Lachnospiraceae bacterium]|nr:GTPase HflX [Lachnospiraceae bacterium]MBP5255133.1 GTPase HflX [Lachnospiraceae bacterium]
MTETTQAQEKWILVSVETPGNDAADSLEELASLVRTAGGETAGTVIQRMEGVHPGTYIGRGKAEEVRELLRETGAAGVVADDELTPAQMKNLEDLLDAVVLDRTVVILDIFARHARTHEGRIQVELAQARYALTRLSGYGKTMSRQGGGIGTRGPGETRLETDRRRIRARISFLKGELADLVRRRAVNRNLREKNRVPVAAVVGYTNAGKSTLLNTLTGAGVLSEDKLFATLDPTTRTLKLPSGQKILLTDTVGFIRKLPHHLVEAFRSTLEEAVSADCLVHVADASNPQYGAQMDVVYETLNMLGASGKPVITLFNKMDLVPPDDTAMPLPFLRDPRAEKTYRISAKDPASLGPFLEGLEAVMKAGRRLFECTFSFADAGKVQLIREKGQLLEESWQEDGVFVKAYIPTDLLDLLMKR